MLHQTVVGHERTYSLPCQHPTELGLTGRAIAHVWPCDRPTVEWNATHREMSYCKARRGQSLDLSDLVPLDADTEESTASRGPPLLGAAQPAPSPETASSPYPIIGNRRSHIYHRPDCPNYSQVAPHNRVEFNSPAEAEAAGYRRAGNCP